jgi:hypothetical protein
MSTVLAADQPAAALVFFSLASIGRKKNLQAGGLKSAAHTVVSTSFVGNVVPTEFQVVSYIFATF